MSNHDKTYGRRVLNSVLPDTDLGRDFVKTRGKRRVRLPPLSLNAPCDCGSGKKAKKCCWTRG